MRFSHQSRPERAGDRPARVFLQAAPVRLDTVAADSPGARAVRWAKSFVGRRYVEGGASPRTGFDCSGLTMYVYDRAGIAALPHNAEQQRHVRYMHRVTRAGALPGDLIFYGPNGSQSVAMFLGNGQMLEAGDPVVTVSPVRTTNMAPYLVRVIA